MKCSLKHETLLRAQGHNIIAGIDEAGRGPLAGPVVAGAAILPPKFRHKVLRDSKLLSAAQRERIYAELIGREDVVWSVAVVTTEDVDRLNILHATYLAMRLAVESLQLVPDHVLIDGRSVPGFPLVHTALIDGDKRSFSIAAASVIAKVTRDRLMLDFDRQFPAYGFAQHKGYSTALHLERLRLHGPCPIHRRSFFPVQQTELSFD
jgi:ribonuclease HII